MVILPTRHRPRDVQNEGKLHIYYKITITNIDKYTKLTNNNTFNHVHCVCHALDGLIISAKLKWSDTNSYFEIRTASGVFTWMKGFSHRHWSTGPSLNVENYNISKSN